MPDKDYDDFTCLNCGGHDFTIILDNIVCCRCGFINNRWF